MDKIIFIDIDGPLAWGTWDDGKVVINEGQPNQFTIPYPWVKEDADTLSQILDSTGAKLVISSDWRFHYSFYKMIDIFLHYGISPWHLLDFTTMNPLWKKMSKPSNDWTRAAQIVKYVKDFKIKNWVAIDDLNLGGQFKYMKTPKYRHVQVDGDFGYGGKLRDKKEQIIKILNK